MGARDPVIVGEADVDLVDGKIADSVKVLNMQARAAKAALGEAGLGLGEVDGLLVAGARTALAHGTGDTLSSGATCVLARR